jgi:hypothetical protein
MANQLIAPSNSTRLIRTCQDARRCAYKDRPVTSTLFKRVVHRVKEYRVPGHLVIEIHNFDQRS